MSDKKTIVEIFSEIGDFSGIDGGHNDKNFLHTYGETYDKLFKPFQSGCTFLEIGLAMGKSIQLWDRYFDNSKIVGVDISLVFEREQYKNNVRLIETDATKPILLQHLKEFKFDLVVEDSTHMTQDQINIFNMLKPQMNKGGIYIIEDLLALDVEREKYLALHENVEIIDMRSTGRFDNALCVIYF